ncbi:MULTISPECIES: transcription elongation factor GreA [Serratia]|uniref:transcription elongation factor GreA n=1 Tax=Serratia TaxID=613 RepID=UPI000EFC6DF1|nr:transcription elongation factor GreA [Serratia sp. P2ACOL2]AYO37443.1 transcription elongation factor GreA [Serratia sp. P2ACOL2]
MPPRFANPDRPFGLVEYTNVPHTIATVISADKATKSELDAVLGVQDMWDLLEIIQVDAHNARVMQEGK